MYAPPHLLILCTIHVQNKIINCLQWYPDFESVDQSQTVSVRSGQSDSQLTSQPNQSGDPTDQRVESPGHEGITDVGDTTLTGKKNYGICIGENYFDGI